MKVIVVSVLLFGLAWANLNCECGERNVVSRKFGGMETHRNEYPWMVALQTIYSAFTFCGGTIVTPWHVVTAAHCVWNKEAVELVLIAGAYNVRDFTASTRQEVLVSQIIIHPYYNATTHVADVSLLVTSTQFVYNEFLGPVCVPNKLFLDELKGQVVKVIGWGNSENNYNTETLREVDLHVTAVQFCEGLQGKKLCTYSPNADPCRGDSGGPVVWLDPDTNRFTLVGVVSTGPGKCGQTDIHSLQTNLSYYRKWLNMRIEYTKQGTVKACKKVCFLM